MEFVSLMQRIEGLSDAEKWKVLAQNGIFPISGGDGSDDGDDDDSDGDEGDDDDESDESGSGKTRRSSDDKTKAKYSEADLERLVKNRLKRGRAKMEADLRTSITDQVKKDLDLEAATKKGDLQKVIDDLKPKAERLAAVEKELGLFHELSEARFDEIIEQLPPEIRQFAPDDDATPVEKERWLITKANPALKAMRKRAARKGRDEDFEAEDDEDDEDEDFDASRKKKSKTRRATPGNNAFAPIPGSKSDKKSLEEIVKGYKDSGAYSPM